MSDALSKLLFSRKESAALTGLSLRTISQLLTSGELRSIRVGRRRLIPRLALAQFVQSSHSTSPATRKQVGR